MDSAALASAAFAQAMLSLRAEYEDLPDGETLLPLIIAKLEAALKAPPVEDFEYGCRKVFAADELRVLLFNPQEHMIKFYPVMLSFVASQPSPSNERVKGLLLSLMYLVHRKSWSFLEEFVLSGGLPALALLVVEPTLQLRGQVMEVLLQITDCDGYDWFKKADSAKDTALHAQLLGLAESRTFLPGLMANRRDSYPGGSLRALQILAFYISWVRAMYTEDNRLVLDRTLLSELLLWSHESEACEDERSLAGTVHRDFSVDQFRLQDGQEAHAPPPGEGALLSGYRAIAGSSAAPLQEPPPLLPGAPAPQAGTETGAAAGAAASLLDRREAGNAFFKQGALARALDEYDAALALLSGSPEPLSPEAKESAVSLHYNRAAVFWKLAKQLQAGDGSAGTGEEDDLPGLFELQRCEQACLCALRLEPMHVKSTYRLASALLLLRRPGEGLAVADAALARLAEVGATEGEVAPGISGGDDKTDVLRSVRRKCVAALLLRAPGASAAALIDSRTSKVLFALQSRSRREQGGVSHAYNGFVPPEEAPADRGGVEEVAGEAQALQKAHKEQKKKATAASPAAGAKVKASKKAVEAIRSLRAAASAFEGGVPAGKAGDHVARACAAMEVLRAEATSLSSALSCLEEPMLLLLLHVALHHHAEGRSSLAAETLLQLAACDRIDTALRLALFGQRELGQELLRAATASLPGECSLMSTIRSSVS